MFEKVKGFFKPKPLNVEIGEPSTSTRIGFPEYPSLKSAHLAVVKITTTYKVWKFFKYKEFKKVHFNTSLVATRSDKTKPKIKFTYLSNQEDEQLAINETFQKFFLKLKAHDIKNEFISKATRYDKC